MTEEKKALKGLTVHVYSTPLTRSCALNGPTAKYDTLTLVGKIPSGLTKYGRPFPEGVIDEIFKATEDRPAVMLEVGPYGSLRAVPVDPPEGSFNRMFGGNYISTSDSRFPCDYPIPVHDRYEPWG